MINTKRIAEVSQGITPLSLSERGGIIMILNSYLGKKQGGSMWNDFSDKDLLDLFLKGCSEVQDVGYPTEEEVVAPPSEVNIPVLAGLTAFCITLGCVIGYTIINL